MTASRLVKGMYPFSVDDKEGLFGLRTYQRREDDEVMLISCGWYNRNGEHLGWGDLSRHDVERISRELVDDELFILLRDNDAFFWMGRSVPTGQSFDCPGKDYVAENCYAIIVKGKLYFICDTMSEGVVVQMPPSGIMAEVMPRHAARKLITGS